jgi:hypothetical protein
MVRKHLRRPMGLADSECYSTPWSLDGADDLVFCTVTPMSLNLHYTASTVEDRMSTYKLGVMEDLSPPRFQQQSREM